MTPTDLPAARGTTRPSRRSGARRVAMQALYQWQLTVQPIGEVEALFQVTQIVRMADDVEGQPRALAQQACDLRQLVPGNAGDVRLVGVWAEGDAVDRDPSVDVDPLSQLVGPE